MDRMDQCSEATPKSHCHIFFCSIYVPKLYGATLKPLNQFKHQGFANLREAVCPLKMGRYPMYSSMIYQLLNRSNIHQASLVLDAWVRRSYSVIQAFAVCDKKCCETFTYSMSWDAENEFSQHVAQKRKPIGRSVSAHCFSCQSRTANSLASASLPVCNGSN